MATELHQTDRSLEHEGILSRAALQVRQFVCGLHGHDSLMHFDHGRISLLCTSCGHETPGWDVGCEEPPRPTVRSRRNGSERTSRLIRMPLTHQRRVA